MKEFDWRKFLNDNGKVVYPGEPINAERLASILKRKCGGIEARATVIGYTQRGAQPTAQDSAFAFEAATWPCSCSTAASPTRPSASAMDACSTCPLPTH